MLRPPGIAKRDLLVFLTFLGLTVFMTWPLLKPGSVFVPNSDDTYFSIWRLAWIAHQITTDPRALFDANVFYPATDVLAYSDAMLLVGIAGAPFFWLGMEPAAIHNGLFGASFVTSMCMMYVLALRLTSDRSASFLAAILFGFAPYRFAHTGHLELQWVVWMPMSLWLLHKLFDSPKPSTAIALGAALSAQILCSIYYGLFLAAYLVVAWCGLAITSVQKVRVARMTVLAALPLLVVVGIYGPPYARSREAFGPRRASEVSDFSATPADFLRVSPLNRLRGADDGKPFPDERSLFPGAVAVVLALASLWPPIARNTWLYLVLALFSIEAALGANGFVFPVLQWLVPAATSLRAPARFGILVVFSLSMLAAIAAARFSHAHPRRALGALAICTILALTELWSAPLVIRPFPSEPTEAERWLAAQPATTVVLELPLPRLDSLWLYETTFQVRSIHHWKHLVNGYSGFVPQEYARTLEAMRSFPDSVSIQRLRELGVTLVLVNRGNYADDPYERLVSSLEASADFEERRTFGTGSMEVFAVRLKR